MLQSLVKYFLIWNFFKSMLTGIPDERSGEIPRAYVVKSQDEITDKDIIDQVANALSKHKHLAGGVEFIDAIPKSAAGKILRKDLKAAFAAK